MRCCDAPLRCAFVTQKLALYFLSQNSASRVLDADQQPLHGNTRGWTIGRLPTCDIAWSVARNPNYGMVSKRHALITASRLEDTTEGGTVLHRWEIIDHGDHGRGSTNGTYLAEPGGKPYRIQPGVPYIIGEGDRVQFGCSDATVKFSFDIDDTHGLIEVDTDPNTGAGDSKKETTKEVTGRTVADVVALVLTGPPGVNRWLWWFLCLVVGLLFVWLREQ